MTKKCPNCKGKIDYLQVSKQIEGTQPLSDPDNRINYLEVFFRGKEPLYPIQWKPPEEQKEPLVHTCPLCLVEIEDNTLVEWGLN